MLQGNAAEALDTYLSIFSDFVVERVESHGEDENGDPDGVKQTFISFAGHKLIVLDSPPIHAFDFTPAMSLIVNFDSKEAPETAFVRLSEDGKIVMPINGYDLANVMDGCRISSAFHGNSTCETDNLLR